MFGKSFTLVAFVSLLSLWAVAQTQELSNDTGKTLSPYFLITSDDPSVDRLPLLSTSAKVSIAGVIADVKVSQMYKNDGRKAIEAIYVFPASTRAAVYGMRMTIGGRVIQAVIKEKQQARAEYETAKQQGKSVSLLEQQRPNVFQMNVANIMPGDTIKVELSYTELLVPVDNVYEFVYPTVVGPRYSNRPEAGAKESDTWTQNPYLHAGEKPSYTFSIGADVRTGVPIQEMTCPSHKVTINYDSPATASVSLDNTESGAGNRDFILKYRLAGKSIESGLLLYKGEKENFFLLMVQPPRKVALADIPRREYIFIVDVSGSMNGFPLEISKRLLKDLISSLRSTDCFNVELFAGGSNLLSGKSLPATPGNIQKAIAFIDEQQGGGGTELLPALKQALNLPHEEGTSRSVVIATDGYVDVETEAFELIRNNLNRANMFAFGIGSSVNRHLIEGMAHVGGGEPFVITSPDHAAATAEKFREYIRSPVLTRIGCSYDNFNTYDIEPVSIPDVMALRPIIIFGKWRGKPQGTITLSGHTGGEEYVQHFNVGQVKESSGNAALRYLWARNRIATLGDFNALRADDSRIREITTLGLNYNLLTAYTSFIAVDSEIRNRDGKSQSVKQALPMPDGVPDLAVGDGAVSYGSMGSSTSPACRAVGGGSGIMSKLKCFSAPAPADFVETAPQCGMGAQTSSKGDAEAISREKKELNQTLPLQKGAAVSTIDSSVLQPHGRTVMYFWSVSCTKCTAEIEAIIRFAKKNPSVNVVVVNLDGKNRQAARLILTNRFTKIVPANVKLVVDPDQKTCTKFGVPSNAGSLPVVLFMVDTTVIKSLYGGCSYWSDATKVLGLFGK